MRTSTCMTATRTMTTSMCRPSRPARATAIRTDTRRWCMRIAGNLAALRTASLRVACFVGWRSEHSEVPSV
jgi:hypothetical protein